jgi:hypothetical protein
MKKIIGIVSMLLVSGAYPGTAIGALQITSPPTSGLQKVDMAVQVPGVEMIVYYKGGNDIVMRRCDIGNNPNFRNMNSRADCVALGAESRVSEDKFKQALRCVASSLYSNVDFHRESESSKQLDWVINDIMDDDIIPSTFYRMWAQPDGSAPVHYQLLWGYAENKGKCATDAASDAGAHGNSEGTNEAPVARDK